MGNIPIANVDTTNGTSTIAYVTADQLGTPRAIANSSGTTEWQNPYQGNVFEEVQPTSTGYTYNLRSSGEYYDAETGLDDNIFRSRDTATWRFLQSDPTGLLGGVNTYAVVGNSPLGYNDPSGLFPNPAEATCVDPLQPICWAGIGFDLATTAIIAGELTSSDQPNIQFAKPKAGVRPKGAKPKSCPAGTRPIDQFPGLSKDDVHTIKDGVRAGPQDWTGIAPNGDVITGDSDGNAVNNGPKGDYLPGGQ